MKKLTKILFFIFLIPSFLYSQIPNNGFEQWTSFNGFEVPDSWGSLNQVTKSYSVASASKLSPGSPGNYYLVVKTVSITGKGLIPGRVVSGKIDTITYKPVQGFAFLGRPEKLSYTMQYMVYSPLDTAFISVILTKWNSTNLKRDTVAYGINKYNAMAHQWFTGNIYLNYKNGNSPDSCCIVISSSGTSAVENSYIYLDDLNFSGSVIGIQENHDLMSPLIVFPTPFNETLQIKSSESLKDPIGVCIYDSYGRSLYESTKPGLPIVINTSDWPCGIYLIKYTINGNEFTKKLVK